MADAQKMIELHSETSERFSCLKQDSSTFIMYELVFLTLHH